VIFLVVGDGEIILRYVCPQKLQEILIDLIGVRPNLIREFIPGAIKDLHFLQNTIRSS